MNKVAAVLVLHFALAISAIAETTGLSLVSLSVQIQPGTARDPLTREMWNMSISSSGDSGNPNGELGIADQDVPYTHQSFFVLQDPTTLEFLVLPFALDVPEQGDENGDGLPDFFDPEVATDNLQTSGRHMTEPGQGADFTARWSRAAGASTGTLVLNLSFFGLTFTHEYNILNYQGLFTFTRTNTNLQGTVALTNALSGTNQLSGPLSLAITNTDRLGYSSGAWVDDAGQTNTFNSVDSLDRIGTNYVALFHFDDGLLQTSEPDYPIWLFLVRSQDANTNNIPDLVERPGDQPLGARLEISKTAQGIQLTVHRHFDGGYVLQSSDAVASEWKFVQTGTLTGGSAVVQLPATEGKKFFRVLEQ